MGVPRLTVRVSNIPRTAIAEELLSFFESVVGPVFACEIASAHRNWMSLGFGRVQFKCLAAAENACFLYSKGLLPVFQRSNLAVFPSPEDILPRAVDASNRISGGILHAGILGEGQMEVFTSWEGVVLEFMPERKKMEIFLEDGRESYKLVVMFEDITASHGCCLGGGGGRLNSILVQLKFAPRIYQRVSDAKLKPKFTSDRYHICEESFPFVWLRTSDFSLTNALGSSSYFCLELENGLYISDIFMNFPYYSEMGEVILSKKEALCSLSKLVPIIGCSDKAVLAYDMLFQLNSLVHTQKISLLHSPDIIDILRKEDSDTILKIFMKMHKFKSTCSNPVEFLERELLNMRRNQKAIPANNQSLSQNLMRCYRALITPSKVYFLGPELENSNYVIKHFSAYSSDFLRVSFVDEDWGKLSSDALSARIEQGFTSKAYKTGIYDRILSILQDGIIIGSKKFEFLAFSASQLRANSCWMFSSNCDVTAESIRNWMGDFNKIRSVSKCAARMGQQFSSSFPAMCIESKDVDIIDDIYCDADGIKYCFSDGIGKVSLSLAEQIAQRFGMNRTPSAFQIRYGGYKGVIAVDQTSFRKLSLRPSMLKFDSKNTMVNITSYSKYLPSFLNREIISLLSTLGVEDGVFEAMQHYQMSLLDNMLMDKDAALEVISKISGPEKEKAENLLLRGYEPSSLPYLSMLLRAYRAYQLSDIRSRCRIFVPKGRILIGCLDESGTLDYGQVFLRVTMTKEEQKNKSQTFFKDADHATVVITGRVVVTKNPCLHPGDIRVLEAICDPQLDEMGLVDCLVFPQKGERPHPNECSGGDLDGDLYFVSWDERLVPLQTDPPMDYIGLRPRLQDHEVTLEEIHKFFVDYMINDNLGAISTAHLVYADSEPLKARSPKCLQLANLHSMAVDFAKTGVPAEMPRILRPKEFPDFMERWDRSMYTSKGVLGKLYRSATAHQNKETSNTFWSEELAAASYDNDLEVEGFEMFLKPAEDYYNQYAEKLSFLMNYFGAVHEDEILTGYVRSGGPSYVLRDKKKFGDIADRIMIAVKSLHQEVKSWFSSCRESESLKMASAWYHITCHPKYWSSNKFLSFPWIIWDVLLNIKDSKSSRGRGTKEGTL
ncbi:probable RNA-dependent RNA polymerase 2 [Dendrobium catenatum]|uniref:RNA-dependent RNA polymerase n=1 Tax=Dendrobium catenatum TaxID=906689 RepID=A0A2I0VZ29_9ASPA|nr:probable RNA-dependent RNA polymerase 2 [Dendrobium catenatum]PKU68673.1 RNA-dependent RNA polymerase 2 [Dendrobium catenatum]